MGSRGAALRALLWLLLVGALPARRTPTFRGDVAENLPAGTRVRGLSVPLTRLGPEPWCAEVRGRRWHLQLLGEGRSHFRAALHARTARVSLRTRRPLDREARPLYSLRLALCCKRCAPRGAPAPAELAALTVRVLDDNDNAPRFVPPAAPPLRVAETLPLRSEVWRARAEDADAGANAELRYFALPRSAHFFVVPRSGRVVLVRSLLHRRAPIALRLFARDRGRPPRLSQPLRLEVLPQPARLPPPRGDGAEPRTDTRDDPEPRDAPELSTATRPDPELRDAPEPRDAIRTASELRDAAEPRTSSDLRDGTEPRSATRTAPEFRDAPESRAEPELRDGTEPRSASRTDPELRGPTEPRDAPEVRAAPELRDSAELHTSPEPRAAAERRSSPPPRRRRSAPPPRSAPRSLSVPEDARPGSLVAALPPAPFPAARFELLSPPEAESPLRVERESGELRLVAALDREAAAAWELLVRVRQRHAGKDWYLVPLLLTVTDVNDNVPEWVMEPFPFSATVSPGAAGGTKVYKLLAVDADEGIHGAVEYFLLEGGEDRFEVEKDTGWIKTTGLPLVRDKEYLLTVLAADQLGSRGAPASISVIAGSRPPQFTNVSYFVHVPESTPRGKAFLTVTAVSYQNKSLSYSLLTNPSGLFGIDWATGDISLTRSVDYESDQHQYLLLVRAEENEEQFSSAAEVLVVITDVNDCAPEFHQSIYSKVGVPETVSMTTALLQVTATDCDSKENAEIRYYTLTQDFSITPDGTIFPATQLDYERPDHLHEFIVMAVDKGEEPKTGTATVRIHTSNVNDEAPEFSQKIYRSFVSEDAGPNTLIATVNAVDPDGDGVTYDIVSGNQKGNFVIDPKKGLVRLRSSPFPKLQGTQYILNVTATDDNASGGPRSLTSTAQIIVSIDDVNNKPVFHKCQSYQEQASVLENQPPGTVVLQVEASDADEGINGVVKYGLMHRAGVLPAFSIHPDTGVLTTAQVFDREKQRDYPITVTATDQAAEPLIGICQINVIVLDQNDNDPRFENTRYEYFLREDTRVGTSFLRVAAHDDDYSSNAAITYSMADEKPNYLQINPTTGWVFVNQPISQRSSIIEDIIATDGGNRSSKVELAVTVTSAENQPPQWERDSYEVVIPENITRDTSILTIKATSPLGDPRVTYNLEEGLVPESNMPVRFYLTPNRHEGSASILVAEPLDYETTKNFLLRVRAQNVAAVPLAAFTTVYINVTDVNDNVPFFTSSIYEASVTEGADVGTFVVQVSATDLDLGQNGEIIYSLLRDSGRDYTYFHLDSRTGSIYTASVFDREKKGSYLLEVQSIDGSESARPGKHGKPNSDTAYVRVFISDVNDNKPIFTRSVYEVNVDEDLDVGSTIITVSANDEDEGANAKLRYQITAGNTGGVLGVEPETGAIFIAQPLDYEETKMYEIHLLASDGKWEDYAVIIINVLNINDETPVFSINEYYGSIIEELDGLPVFVLQVMAKDPDSSVGDGDLRYSLHGHGATDIFTMDEKTGSIYSHKRLDREERALWRFVVLATDEGGEGLTGFADVIINVWDVNDNAPVFTCMLDGCNGNVFENSPVDTLVMEMGAVDRDDPNVGLNAVLTYRIIENVRNEFGTDMFRINPSTGTIHVAGGMLDRERTARYFLTVEVRDGGGLTGTGTATIWIADINDHIPEFTEKIWQATIPENSAVDSEVLRVCALDADVGQNADLTFSIAGGDPDQKFYIGNDGEWQCASIRLKKRLDFENTRERQFNLTITVEDLDFSSIALCLIEVEDSNDHSPVFLSQFIQTSPVFENLPVGTTVATVTATDKDSGLNGNIIYSIKSDSDPMRQFAVDQYGHVVVANMLDREVIKKYSLIVEASDQGTPARTGSVTVLINLLDVNDNGPRFEAPYMPVVWENIPRPEIVRMNHTSTLLHVFDPDSEENGPPFTFSLPPGYQHSLDFSLTDNRNNTATVTALRPFDREKQKVFYLPVVIRDSGIPAMSSTNTLTITIGDENDNCHEPGHKDVYVYSLEGKWSTTALGEVFVLDQDDWDNKTFLSEGKLLKSFSLNQKTGSLVMVDNTPQGAYNLNVRVSDGVCPDVISTVQIHVKELENEAVQNSASVRLSDVTAEEFIRRDGDGKTRHDKFKELLAKMLPAELSDISVFSVMNVGGKQTDVRFAARRGSGYYSPEKLHAEMAAFKTEVQAALQLNISHIDVDECRSANCTAGSSCTNQLSVSNIPTVTDTGSVSFVSVTATVDAVCGCSARDRVHRSCSSYPHSPCLNGGRCIDTLNGYRCLCPASFHGPDCQQTKRSFHGNGYAWFPPIRPCFESSLSLEFITAVPDGLLLYSGPLSNPEPQSAESFIAIELSGGVPVLKMSRGSGFVVLQFPSHLNVADKKWHQLEVRTSGQDVRFTLDRCSAAVVSEIEGVGKWLFTEDRTDCEVLGFVPQRAGYLKGSHVLQLGGVKESLPYSYPQLLHKHFSGCLRNFILDTQVYDLQSPAESLNSFPGCMLTDGSCETLGSSSCGIHGRCHGDWGSFACQCLPGYYGYRCDKVAKEYTFGPGSHIRYQLPVSVPVRRMRFEAMIRTRQPDGVITSVLSRNKDEYVTLQVVRGFLVVSYNLGDGDYSVSLPSYRIDNGEWHPVTLERNENEFTLRLYEGGGKREVLKAAGAYKEIVIDPSSLILGNTYPFHQNKSFQGCMKDVRFNNYRIPLDTQAKELVSVLSAHGVREGCSSEACRNNPCKQEFICIDLWMTYECSCPPGHLIVENATGTQCIYTACAERPCNYGTCIAQSATKFQCHCPDGYAGRNCEITLAIFHKDTGLSFSSMFAICVCFLALLALLTAAFLWARWRRHKALDGGVYPVSAHPEDLEDIRESILNYNEEGGGEQDQDAYDMAELQVSIQTSPACSLYKRENPTTLSSFSPRTREQPHTPAAAEGALASPDFAQLLADAVRDADHHPQAASPDSLRVFCTEGEGSDAGSLSTLSSSGGDEGTVCEDMMEWGPKFRKLRDLYSHMDAEEL